MGSCIRTLKIVQVTSCATKGDWFWFNVHEGIFTYQKQKGAKQLIPQAANLLNIMQVIPDQYMKQKMMFGNIKEVSKDEINVQGSFACSVN